MVEHQAGHCPIPACRFHTLLTRVNRTVVFLGSAQGDSQWLCDEHHAELEATGLEYDLVAPTIDMTGPPTRKIQRNSRKRELEVAADIGGRRQPGSGNQPFAKGDIRKKGEFRVEHKDCYGLEFKVHRRDLLDKIRSECSRDEQPAVVVTFRDKHTHEQLEAWAMVPYEVWVEKMNGTG